MNKKIKSNNESMCRIVEECIAKGYIPIPRYGDQAAPYGDGQSYPADSPKWTNATGVAIRLDDSVLVDWDGYKDNAVTLEQLARALGITAFELEDVCVQIHPDKESRHYLFDRSDFSYPDGMRQSKDGWLPGVDIKTGNQLIALKPEKELNLPDRSELRRSSPLLAKVLDKAASQSPLTINNKSVSSVNDVLAQGAGSSADALIDSIKKGENLHDSTLRLAGRYAQKGILATEIAGLLEALMSELEQDERVQARIDDLPRIAESAVKKFTVSDFVEQAANDDTFSADSEEGITTLKEYDYRSIPKAQKYVVDGMITEGVSVLASYPAGGKTSAMVSAGVNVAGAHRKFNDPFSVPITVTKSRHVVYFTEHPQQVGMLLNAMVAKGWIDEELLHERFHIVSAKRSNAENLANLADIFHGQRYTLSMERNGVKIDVSPWVIFDTTSAMINLDDENSNSAWSQALAILKEAYTDIPLTLVAHTSKAGKGASDATKLTTRGGSALEGDATQIMFLTIEDEQRYIDVASGKHRFVRVSDAFKIDSEIVEVDVVNEFNERLTENVRICRLSLITNADKEAVKRDAERLKMVTIVQGKRSALKNRVDDAIRAKKPLTLTAFRDQVQRLGIEGYSKTDKAHELADLAIDELGLRVMKKGGVGCQAGEG